MGNGFGFALSGTLTDLCQITERKNALANDIGLVCYQHHPLSRPLKWNTGHGMFLATKHSLADPLHISHPEARRQACFIAGMNTMSEASQDMTNILISKITRYNAKSTLSRASCVPSRGISFSSINFTSWDPSPLQFGFTQFGPQAF